MLHLARTLAMLSTEFMEQAAATAIHWARWSVVTETVQDVQ